MEMTVEQKRAMAIAMARKRAAEAQGGAQQPGGLENLVRQGMGLDPKQQPHATAIAPTPTSNKHTGFSTQVRQAIKDPGLPVQIPTEQEFAQGFKDAGIGALQGVPSGAVGLPGDVMSLANAGLGAVGAPQMPRPWTTTEAGNAMFGQPSSNIQAFGRGMGAMAGPPIAGAAIKQGAKAVGAGSQYLFGATTGAGRPAIQEAVKAGREGGQAAETFLNHMRGNIASDEAVRLAKDAVSQMRAEKSAAYRAGIGTTIKGDPAVLDFKLIDDAVNKASTVKTFKGQSLSGMADKARQRVGEVLAEWKALPADEFHTPEGLDALKQKLGDLIYEGDLASVKPHSPASIVINDAYHAVRDTIAKHAKGYADVMADYTKASEQIREVERTLSLGNKATADTGLRKLQSILRNNVNTNYGARVQAGQQLAQRSPELMPALAGQSLNSVTPRGIQGALAGTGAAMGIPAAITGALNPAYLGALASSSPRLIGEAAFAMGNARRMGANLLNPLKNAGIASGGAGISGINPRLLAQMSPQMLNQLLLGARAPAGQ